mmetsp:Transcript_12624/g.25082  ORF Transcript_12624/g.25082 Transcript_12624/m.25082 type:complete len:258 (+) Transcript_12624:170-943(+)|eukprot:CAMPEP_0182462226 /NCGR_PEP_ID=MMETSP1319-20130603/6563_1 /TAXON_ID=172717 /ORGANISM="Bolidomonas pacifica, Strain RCC208" /LENGTH=257 /DNA_ID=CAMNT_0024661631 /DNA_START=171 /DNA_END=944 /DNA_ORIENTATION=-
MSSTSGRSRRPSWGNSNSSAFYSGKAPANAGKQQRKSRENKQNTPNIPPPGAVAPELDTKEQRVAIPDYTRKATKPKGDSAAKVGAAEKPAAKNAAKGKPKRPSLSEQLASIGAQASSLTASIKANAGMETEQASMSSDGEPPVLSTPSKAFKVGSLECKFPSPVLFFKDKCTYTFHHPYKPSEIFMLMRYTDMSSPTLTKPSGHIGDVRFRFKVMRSFEQFKGVYGPGDWVEIRFSARSDYENVRDNVMPLIRGKK